MGILRILPARSMDLQWNLQGVPNKTKGLFIRTLWIFTARQDSGIYELFKYEIKVEGMSARTSSRKIRIYTTSASPWGRQAVDMNYQNMKLH